VQVPLEWKSLKVLLEAHFFEPLVQRLKQHGIMWGYLNNNSAFYYHTLSFFFLSIAISRKNYSLSMVFLYFCP